MNHSTTVVGLDVHKDTVAVAVLPAMAEQVAEITTIENNPRAIDRMVRRVTEKGPADFIYEAGPCGYEIHRQIAELGFKCAIVAPGLIPRCPADRVKTDYRDARKLARLYRAGELTEIQIPGLPEEAARDLTRASEAAVGDRLSARNRLSMFMLRHGRVFRARRKNWGVEHQQWLGQQVFDLPIQQQSFEAHVRTVKEAQARVEELSLQVEQLAQEEYYRLPVNYLRCLRGVETLTAMTLIAETQDFHRFREAPAFMSFTGLVCSEYSSGNKIRRGSITKAGNAHIRRVLGESAWAYRYARSMSQVLAKRRAGNPDAVVKIAEEADRRLRKKYAKLLMRGKPHQVAVTAVARELAGFVWAIARHFPMRTQS